MYRYDRPLMALAVSLGRQALLEDELPVGCVIARGHDILGVGRRAKDYHYRLDHAEIVAMRQALPCTPSHDFLVTGLTLYTTLEPCIMCFGAILHAKIPRVIYALADPFGGATEISIGRVPRHVDSRPQVVGGLMRYEARQLFAEFFRTTKNQFWRLHQDNPLCQLCRS